jgi:hypothetical protein
MKKKNTPPSMEQWAKLYEVAATIKNEAPWNTMWDTDLVTIMLPGKNEPICISVMGRNGECYGIGVYPGYRSIAGFYRLLESSEEDLQMNPLSFQNCLMCYYGNRDELAPKEREVIKSLNLKFRGENNWIYFRSMEEGYYPWFINADQAELMIDALQNFAMAYMHLSSGKINVDFENGETLMRQYSPERKEWLNGSVPMPPIPEISGELVFKDELLLKRLQNKPKNNVSVEMDILYLPTPVQDKPDETPYFPRLLVLLDRKNRILLNQKLLDKKIKSEEAVTDELINYISKYGKPGKLFVRDRYFVCYVDSLCSQLGVSITFGKGMLGIDEFAEQMTGFMSEM